MGLRINQSIAALTAARALQARQKALATSIERLSSGLRINSGADDPAGLIVSENLRVQADSLDRNIRNNQDKTNQLRTEDAKLGEVFDQLRAVRSRALDSLNAGGSGDSGRAANQSSARSSVESINRTLRGVDTAGGGVDSSGLSAISQSLEGIDISTAGGAEEALATVDAAIENLSTFRSQVGSRSNGFEASIRSESAAAENIRASESAIRDTDFAEATVDFVKNQILFQASVSVLAKSKEASKSKLGILDSGGGAAGARRLLGIA